MACSALTTRSRERCGSTAQASISTAGRGYIEKDWGQSFPSAWVWFQSNHFETPGTSLTASVAVIPFLGGAFRGFIVGLWHERRLYRFATYTGAEIETLDIQPDHVRWVIVDKEHRLELIARRAPGAAILGPTTGGDGDAGQRDSAGKRRDPPGDSQRANTYSQESAATPAWKSRATWIVYREETYESDSLYRIRAARSPSPQGRGKTCAEG